MKILLPICSSWASVLLRNGPGQWGVSRGRPSTPGLEDNILHVASPSPGPGQLTSDMGVNRGKFQQNAANVGKFHKTEKKSMKNILQTIKRLNYFRHKSKLVCLCVVRQISLTRHYLNETVEFKKVTISIPLTQKFAYNLRAVKQNNFNRSIYASFFSLYL